jgi:hypothetical protein
MYINVIGLIKKLPFITSLFNSNILDQKIILNKFKIFIKIKNKINNLLEYYLPYNSFEKRFNKNIFLLNLFQMNYIIIFNNICINYYKNLELLYEFGFSISLIKKKIKLKPIMLLLNG